MGLEPRRRKGKLLILRLTPRGLRRLRLDIARSSKISSSTLSWNAPAPLGGMTLKLEVCGGQLVRRAQTRAGPGLHLP